MSGKNRTAAVLAVLLACILILSVVYIAAEADHDCHGEHCVICEQIRSCVARLKTILPLLAAYAALLLIGQNRTLTDGDTFYTARAYSLITLKVKLSN